MSPVRIDIWVQSAGMGHVTRQVNLCRALREEFREEGVRIRFIVDDVPGIAFFAESRGFDTTVRSNDVTAAAAELKRRWDQDAPDLFILDTVNHDTIPEVQTLLRDSRVRTFAIIDDIADRPVAADLTLNALPGFNDGDEKPSDPLPTRIRGLQYLIQDLEFAEFHNRVKPLSRQAVRGFAFFGGSDINGFTPVFLESLRRGSSGIQWSLLVGGILSPAEREGYKREAAALGVELLESLPSVAETLWSSDIAVLAAGNVVSEAASVGTPCITVSQLDVQAENARFYAERLGTIDLGGAGEGFPLPLPTSFKRFASREAAVEKIHSACTALAADFDGRKEMRERMLTAVDGKGAFRVAGLLRKLLFTSKKANSA